MIKIICVEDKPVLLEFLVQTLQDEPDIEVVAACDNMADATSSILKLKPDIVILDIGLPDGNGLDMMQEIMKSDTNSKFIIYTIYSHSDIVKKALLLGAFSYILKTATPQEIISTIYTVYETDHIIIPQEILQTILPSSPLQQNNNNRTSFNALSITERQILKLLKDNMSYNDIADNLQISINTVRYYIKNIYKKLNIQSRYEIK